MWSKTELKLLFFPRLKRELGGSQLLWLAKSLLGFPPCPVGGKTRVSQFLVPYGYYWGVALCFHLKLTISVIPFAFFLEKQRFWLFCFLPYQGLWCFSFLFSSQSSCRQPRALWLCWRVRSTKGSESSGYVQAKNSRYATGRGGLGEPPLPQEPICGCFLW